MMDKWINNNTISKVLALAIGVLLWGMVHLDDVSTTPVPTAAYDTKAIPNVKIQTHGLDEDKYVLSAMETDRVRLEVRGQRSDLTSFFTDDYRVELDLSQAQPGTNTYPLVPDLPDGVKLVSMEPSMVTATIEEKSTKAFTPVIITKGVPSDGYQLGTPVIDGSPRVKVTLPKSQLDEVQQIQGVVDVSGAEEDVTLKKVKLKAYDKEGHELSGAVIEPPVVTARVPVTKGYVSLPVKVNYTGKLPDGLVLSKVVPNVDVAAVYAKQSDLSSLGAYVPVTLDLGKIKEAGTTTVEADLQAPGGAERVEPAAVKLEVTVSPEADVQSSEEVITGVPVTLKGASSRLDAAISSPSDARIDVTVTAPADMLRDLGPEDVSAVANISGLEAGQHQVPVTVTLPEYVTLAGKDTSPSVTVTIKEKSSSAAAAKPDQGGTGSTGNTNSSTENGNKPNTDSPPKDDPTSGQQENSGEPSTTTPETPADPAAGDGTDSGSGSTGNEGSSEPSGTGGGSP
ncbi:CdaR family protein [Paenibacillus sp. JX-17]|uniref:CdaR family protein n=1 Tax=Paenibacillus lacisoli TaxID=3064525 RepID=A0ABT9CLE2_9BACL|nr:CdaR family protein [Paenibacillus sp. JX-17]MDO7908742.1 CdaR family protein [Paenibacillus sp. JX-17]